MKQEGWARRVGVKVGQGGRWTVGASTERVRICAKEAEFAHNKRVSMFRHTIHAMTLVGVAATKAVQAAKRRGVKK